MCTVITLIHFNHFNCHENIKKTFNNYLLCYRDALYQTVAYVYISLNRVNKIFICHLSEAMKTPFSVKQKVAFVHKYFK